MHFSLRRYVWVVDLIGIAIGAALAGTRDGDAAGRAPAAARDGTDIRARAPRGDAVAAAGKSIDAIVDRNVFCSTCSDAPVLAANPGARSGCWRSCSLARRRTPHWSIAVIRDDESATTGSLRRGRPVGRSDDRGHRRGARRSGSRPRPTRNPGPPSAMAGGAVEWRSRGDVEGVREIGAGRYEVRRAALDRFLQGASRPGRASFRRRGKANRRPALGWRPSGQPFAALGLASGDVLLEVNGRPMRDPMPRSPRTRRLRSADRLSLLIERGGRRIRLDYVIR